MANRRQAALCCRRLAHTAMRRQGVIRQEAESSSEGPDDSPRAAKSQKALRARRA
jgi:hypothetical protein